MSAFVPGLSRSLRLCGPGRCWTHWFRFPGDSCGRGSGSCLTVPAWTLASGPAHQARPADSLVPRPGDLPLAVAAVHHACDTLTSLAYAQREQIRAAGAAQRLLVPTRSLPETIDVPRPFAPALPERIDSLVSACDQTARSAEAATASVAAVAAAIGAPSRVLTAAKEAADPTPHSDPGRGEAAARARDATDRWVFPDEVPELPGPVERTLHYLGITNTELLRHGADIDRAGERLIIDAAASLEPRRNRPSAITLSGSVGTDPGAVTLLRGPGYGPLGLPQRGPGTARPSETHPAPPRHYSPELLRHGADIDRAGE